VVGLALKKSDSHQETVAGVEDRAVFEGVMEMLYDLLHSDRG